MLKDVIGVMVEGKTGKRVIQPLASINENKLYVEIRKRKGQNLMNGESLASLEELTALGKTLMMIMIVTYILLS